MPVCLCGLVKDTHRKCKHIYTEPINSRQMYL